MPAETGERLIAPAERTTGDGLAVDVGGTRAATIDRSDYTAARLPLFIGGVVGLSFLLLTAVSAPRSCP